MGKQIGLWCVHRAFRAYRDRFRPEFQWWSAAPADIRRAADVGFVCEPAPTPSEMVRTLALRYIRRYPNAVRFVGQYNQLIERICSSYEGVGHPPVLRACKLHNAFPGTRIVFSRHGGVSARWDAWDVRERQKSIQKARTARVALEKHRAETARDKAYREVWAMEVELSHIRHSLTAAKAAMKARAT